MIPQSSDTCQLRVRDLATPMGRVVLEAPVWPNDLRTFAGHGDLCVHAVLPRERGRWNGLFAGVRSLAGRTAHVRVHVQPQRGPFSIDPAVLLLSGVRRRGEMTAAVIADAHAVGVELTPQQIQVESYPATRRSLRLPPATDHARAWGVISVAWFPLTGPAPRTPPSTRSLQGKEHT